jgi:hypothetical protein
VSVGLACPICVDFVPVARTTLTRLKWTHENHNQTTPLSCWRGNLGGLSGGGEITENRTSSPNSRFL